MPSSLHFLTVDVPTGLIEFAIILINNTEMTSYLLFEIANFNISNNGMILTDLIGDPNLSDQSFINYGKQCVRPPTT